MALPAVYRLVRLVTMVVALCAWLALPKQAPLPIGALDPHAQVVIIIVDGLRPDLISSNLTPTLQRLVNEGASTLEARTVRPSLTLPSVTSMLTGVSPQTHGVTWNDYEPGRGIVTATTIFDIVDAAGLTTAFFSGKVKLRHAADPAVLDAMSVRFLPDASIVVLAGSHLTEKQPNLMVVHLPNVDRAGHDFGWGSRRQRDTLRATDTAVASLLEAIEVRRAGRPVRLIVTADHGGTDNHHFRGRRRDVTVPWIVWGDGVAPATLPPVSITATASTALLSLGLDVPAVMDLGPDGGVAAESLSQPSPPGVRCDAGAL